MKMPGRIAATSVVLLSSNAAAEFNAYATLTTDYVFRGVSYSDGSPAARLGAEVSSGKGFYAGALASSIDIGDSPGHERDLELNYYAGLRMDLATSWSLAATAIAYRYPGPDTVIDYDYEELSLALNYDDRVWLEYANSPGYETQNVELYAEAPLPWALTGGAGVGWYDVSAISNRDYVYWQAGLTRHFKIVDLDLRYHDTSRWVPRVSDEERAEGRVVLSARFQF